MFAFLYNRDMFFRYLLCLLGVILAVPLMVLIALATTLLPVTLSGIGYLSAFSLMIAGLIFAPSARKLTTVLILVNLLVVSGIMALRIHFGQANSTSRLNMITLPRGTQTR